MSIMETESNKLDSLKGRQPFRVPEGYFEGLTEDIMCRLPEKTVEEPKVVSLFERAKPFLYLAAMFVGIVVIINTYKGMQPAFQGDKNGVLAKTSTTLGNVADIGEDAEFLEYIEDIYADKYAISYIDDLMDNW